MIRNKKIIWKIGSIKELSKLIRIEDIQNKI